MIQKRYRVALGWWLHFSVGGGGLPQEVEVEASSPEEARALGEELAWQKSEEWVGGHAVSSMQSRGRVGGPVTTSTARWSVVKDAAGHDVKHQRRVMYAMPYSGGVLHFTQNPASFETRLWSVNVPSADPK